MVAPLLDRPASAEGTARESLLELVVDKGSVDLGEAIAHLSAVPVHLVSRVLNDLLDAGLLTLTEEQQLERGPHYEAQ